MMRTIYSSLAIAFVLMFFWASPGISENDQTEENGEIEISFSELPESLRRVFKEVKVAEVELKTLNKKKIYEIEIVEDDVEFELTINEQGQLLAVEIEQSDNEDDDNE